MNIAPIESNLSCGGDLRVDRQGKADSHPSYPSVIQYVKMYKDTIFNSFCYL